MKNLHYQNEARQNGIFALCSAFATATVCVLGAWLYPEGGLQSTDYIAAFVWGGALLASLSAAVGFTVQWRQARGQISFGLPQLP